MKRKNKNPVLPSMKPILEESKFVHINEERIKELAPKIAKEELPIPDWKPPKKPVFIDARADPDDVVDFFMLGNSINFAFTDFKTKRKFKVDYKSAWGKPWSGAFAMWMSLKRALENGVPILGAKYLENITLNEMRWIFAGEEKMPMLEERTKIFNEVGSVLNEKYDGRFCNLVKKAKYRAFDKGRGIVERLVSDFPSFNDVSIFEPTGDELKFYKRAQLAVGMLYGRFQDTNLFPVKDIDSLTVFADYELPKGLRGMGILEYENSLDERIKKEQLIPKDSREEQEIRAHTIYASDLLIKEINKYRKDKINALNLDYKLWFESKDTDEPHHLTITTAY